MKKYFFLLAAVAVISLTACTSEDDVVQGTTQKTAVADEAVGFDVYVPGATQTRAGLQGTMTTSRLQRSEANGGGFGVYAYLTEDSKGDAVATAYTSTAGQKPNFMVNEKILWNDTNLGWYYNPLKYWPNETDNDSQSTPATMEGATTKHLDRLTFFAYAPYVSAGAGTEGITAITDNAGQLSSTNVTDPTIAYVSTASATDVEPNNYVDLTWGVAPSGGLSYTAVNGSTVTRNEGTPLIDMIKPNVNTTMKFLFQHALARFGITVVAAIDQVSPGGTLDANTKVTINNLKISGPFGITGELNLNNGAHANVANWTKIQALSVNSSSTAISTQEITLTANGTNKAIAENLRYTGPHTFGSYEEQDVIGVTPAKQDLLRPSNKWFTKLAAPPAYTPGKKYYSDENGTTPAPATYTFDDKSVFYTYDDVNKTYAQKKSGTEDAPLFPSVKLTTTYYKLTETRSSNASSAPGGEDKWYSRTGSGTAAEPYVYTYVPSPTWNGTNTYYTVTGTAVSVYEIPFAYTGTIYEAERNFIYVVPTNNIVALNSGLTGEQEKALRTITLQIEYYITTEDSKVEGERTQTKNVITKEVVLPSLANGKSYNLNLILGLTSVKVEAEVDDWKVVNVNADLPQNTAE